MPKEDEMRFLSTVALCGFLAAASTAPAQTPAAPQPPVTTIYENVRIFNGTSDRLSQPSHVLVVGNLIQSISTGAIADPPGTRVTRLAGGGRTLMPGLIDAHTHIMYATLPPIEILTSDLGYVSIAAAKAADEMLMRGFTSIRDVGGPVFGLKRGIDRGLTAGPRIWPSGAFISQSGGHGDFRLPTDMPARPGDFTHSERVGGAAIADNPDLVRQRTRELLALGASQIKLMAGGGVSSTYDPLDVTQYSVPELRAAVEAAENWGTYVTVHAYTPRAVRQSLEAGVRVIEHGQLLDDATAQLMAEKGVWWSLQPFIDDGGDSRFPEGSINRIKQLQMFQGTDAAYALAKKYRIKVAWGTDTLSASATRQQSRYLTRMTRWYSSAEIARMVTADNAQLLALSGERSPYSGKLGVIEEGALADLLLVDGDPTADIRVLEDPDKNLKVVMKDGKIYKNTLR
jgi:imidazolonepropionase-like amidohydrolase